MMTKRSAVFARPKRLFAAISSLVLMCVPFAAMGAQHLNDSETEGELFVYIGTYTRGESEGIYRCRLDLSSGALEVEGLAVEAVNPSFLAIHPSRKYLYSVSEMSGPEGKPMGSVAAFAIDPDNGNLSLLNQQSAKGNGPCHVYVEPGGKYVLAANYGSGSVACLPITNDGNLEQASSDVQHEGSSVDPRRQTGPHAHCIRMDPAGNFALAADLGLDKVLVYRLDRQAGALVPNDPPFAKVPPGSGPRHLAFHPSGRYVYVINELASTITAFQYNAEEGKLDTIETVRTLPEGFDAENYTAEIQVHPSGKWVYGSNRGHDSIAVFRVDGEDGSLKPVQHMSTHGETPRNFGIDPSGKFLLAANQDTGNVVVFAIDQDTGMLAPTGHEVEIPSPVCVKFMEPMD